jgi:regulator of protease activity HflC (stomatin/prohibitin superfamily)
MDILVGVLGLLVPIVIIVLPLIGASVRVVQEYERGVVFRLGRLAGARGPGLILLIPFVERMTKMDLRTITMDVPAQEVITRDNVTVRVNAVVYFRVFDPEKAVVNVADFVRATHQIAQTTLRSVLGQADLDHLLSARDDINQKLQLIIDEQTEPWGIKVSIVEVKDVELPQTMQRAMARQAEAEREKRAKIIHAQGELQASQQLSEAAHVIGSEPATIQLRYLQTLTEIATERNSTIIFPVPIELLALIPHFMPTSTSANGHAPVVPPPDEPERPAARIGSGPATVPPTQPLRPDVETVAPDPAAPPPGFAPRS